jgi:hypothetical protein
MGDELFMGYDAVQLLPVEPTTVYETGPDFWQEQDGRRRWCVDLLRPNTTNWGYDVVISGMAAVNPVLLESRPPDELIDLAAVLHNFPAKAQEADPRRGLRPFGQPGPRGAEPALLRRAEHVRAEPRLPQPDGARDPAGDAAAQGEFRRRRRARRRRAGLQVVGRGAQECATTTSTCRRWPTSSRRSRGRYRPWFIFEDGRPWPEEDWELSSTYRAVIEKQRDDDVFQWGPLTFAHNTPFLYTFWLSKYWRIREMLDVGENWISGTANHDTLRRGTQVSPKLNINTRLGSTRMEILDKAYDNPAVHADLRGLPGVPMDFLNATARASWGFIRNQDDRYGVKVVAEEAISLKWQVDEYSYSVPGNFRRLKELGFETREELRASSSSCPRWSRSRTTISTKSPASECLRAAAAGPEFRRSLKESRAPGWTTCTSTATSRIRCRRSIRSRSRSAAAARFPPRPALAAPEPRRRGLLRLPAPIDGRTVFVLAAPWPRWRTGVRSDYLGGPLSLHDSMGVVFTRG